MQRATLTTGFFWWLRREARHTRSRPAKGHGGLAKECGLASCPHRRYRFEPGNRSADRGIRARNTREKGFVVVTLDADFHAIIAVENASTPSVIRIRREGMKAHALASLLIEVWPALSEMLENGALVTIDDRSVRVRSIPIHK